MTPIVALERHARPRSPRWACLVAFVSAVVFDGLLAQWVAAVAAHRAGLAAVLSMACAVTTLFGFGQAMKGRWPAFWWVLGYGVGSWLAVTLAGR